MNKKPKYKISEEKILQICNDIGENQRFKHYTKNDLIECIKFWQDESRKINNYKQAALSAIVIPVLDAYNKYSKYPENE